MEYVIEVGRLNVDGTMDRVMFRQVLEEDAFDLARIIAGVNGISTRRRSAKPEPKKKATTRLEPVAG
jgi:hypothetical protein